MKKLIVSLSLLLSLGLTACVQNDDASVVSQNLSTAADNFEINRRTVFYNGITSDYILSIEGLCSLDSSTPGKLTVTCKTGPNSYKKHFLGLSDNVTYFSEQIEAANVSAYHYRVIFKPQTIVPDVDLKVSSTDIPKSQ